MEAGSSHLPLVFKRSKTDAVSGYKYSCCPFTSRSEVTWPLLFNSNLNDEVEKVACAEDNREVRHNESVRKIYFIVLAI